MLAVFLLHHQMVTQVDYRTTCSLNLVINPYNEILELLSDNVRPTVENHDH